MSGEGWRIVREQLTGLARRRGDHIEAGYSLTAEIAAAIEAARAEGLSMREIADLLGLSRVRAYRILEAGSTVKSPAGTGRR